MPLTFEAVENQLAAEFDQYKQVLTQAALTRLDRAIDNEIRGAVARANKEGRPLEPDDMPRGQTVHNLFINYVLNNRQLATG